MNNTRTSASLKMRFLSNAIAYLHLREAQISFAVDGRFIYYNPEYISNIMLQLGNGTAVREMLDYMILHITVHCLFRHIFVDKKVQPQLWDTACDIYAFHILLAAEEDDKSNSSKRIIPDTQLKNQEISIVRTIRTDLKLLSPNTIVKWLLTHRDILDQIISQSLFVVDDHTPWHMNSKAKSQDKNGGSNTRKNNSKNGKDDSKETEEENQNNKSDSQTQDKKDSQQEQDVDSSVASDSDNSNEEENSEEGGSNGESDENNDSTEKEEARDSFNNSMSQEELDKIWKHMASLAKTGLETGMIGGKGAGNALIGLEEVTRESYSYEEFLRKFAIMTEQMELNMDEFDYCYYTYGLQLYGNIPLIEPLEYKDTKRIHDFVIAIDTSGSTYGPLVQKFLAKTFNILAEQNSFDSRVCIHIIQCDTKVQHDFKIENTRDLEEYMRNFTIYGQGGTDFRPVFDYVEELKSSGEFTDLRGLIYFTDGYGVFPVHMPEYDTAFAFIGDKHCPLSNVPDWAISLILDEAEFEEV